MLFFCITHWRNLQSVLRLKPDTAATELPSNLLTHNINVDKWPKANLGSVNFMCTVHVFPAPLLYGVDPCVLCPVVCKLGSHPHTHQLHTPSLTTEY